MLIRLVLKTFTVATDSATYSNHSCSDFLILLKIVHRVETWLLLSCNVVIIERRWKKNFL